MREHPHRGKEDRGEGGYGMGSLWNGNWEVVHHLRCKWMEYFLKRKK